jgi:hypothetical protein
LAKNGEKETGKQTVLRFLDFRRTARKSKDTGRKSKGHVTAGEVNAQTDGDVHDGPSVFWCSAEI